MSTLLILVAPDMTTDVLPPAQGSLGTIRSAYQSTR